LYRIEHCFRVSGNYLKKSTRRASGFAPSLFPTLKRAFADA
jgi:hypothetical protein